MQERQLDRALYFRELAATSRKYFLPYIGRFKELSGIRQALEIGCGDGGNLLPLAEAGCRVTGVDMAAGRIKDASRFFREHGVEGTFIASDIFKLKELEGSFDLIICHDVLEHIGDKRRFLSDLRRYVSPSGVVFMAFPAWQMPFGGHQQICRNRVLSHFPFVHLLPAPLYKKAIVLAGEDKSCVRELMEIKKTRTSIELFERLAGQEKIEIVHRDLYFINPHYEVKFGLKPRRLWPFIGRIPYLRDFFTISCFYILRFT